MPARRVVLLEGPSDALVDAARRWLPERPQCPWIGPAAARRPRVEDLLGRDLAGAVVDARTTLDADRFGAAAGAVRGGGTLLVLATDGPAGPPFLRRARALLERSSRAERGTVERWTLADVPATPLRDPPELPMRRTGPERLDAEVAVARCLTGRARRPIVLRADRGRGKSTTLGLGAAEALARIDGDVIVTAPSATAVATLLAHGRARARTLGVDPMRLRWMPPDAVDEALAAAAGSIRGLLVDEAAALPVERLTGWLRRVGRIAFATTVHGYEGTGRGFDVRFRAQLDARTPDWRAVELTEPVRFPPGDPLERLQFELLALDAEPVRPSALPVLERAPPVRALDADELAGDEALLRAVFGLLVQAHYRTRPSDLVRMLDDPAVRVLCAGDSRAPLGCLVSVDEGGLDAGLAEAMARGERRPRGHQGPGVFAAHLGLASGARIRSRRVMRIATHPEHRRRGVGRALVDAAADAARGDGVALLTTQFGATAPLLRFWSACGFAPLRVGARREASSGEHAAFAARALDDDGAAIIGKGRRMLDGELPDLLAEALATMDPAAAAELLRVAEPAVPTPEEVRTARRWIADEIAASTRPAALRRVLAAALATPGTGAIDRTEAMLVARLLQRRSWRELAEPAGTTAAEAEARGRKALAALLNRAEIGSQPQSPPTADDAPP